ncbi:hypothetical protein ACF0H5_023523 [Mactra antiquata]
MDRIVKILSIFIEILSIQNCVFGLTYTSSFHRLSGVTLSDGNYQSELKALSRVDCISRCPDCHVTRFDKITQLCYNYAEQNNTYKPWTGADVWMNNLVGVFMVERNDRSLMSHGEAGTLCNQVNARLATTLELYQAWQDGYHMCRCGWLQDTTVRFTLIYDDTSCTIPRMSDTGLLSCKDEFGQYPSTVSFAYCIRN